MCKKEITVKEFKELLNEYDENLIVVIEDYQGFHNKKIQISQFLDKLILE